MSSENTATENVELVGNILTIPSVHDGLLTGIVVEAAEDGKQTLLLFLRVSEEKLVVRIPDVVEMHFNDFMLGNIIFDLTVSTIDEAGDADLLSVLLSSEPDDMKLAARLREKYRDSTWLGLSTSYGCFGSAIVRSNPKRWTFTRG